MSLTLQIYKVQTRERIWGIVVIVLKGINPNKRENSRLKKT